MHFVRHLVLALLVANLLSLSILAAGQDAACVDDDMVEQVERLEAMRENLDALLPGIQRQQRQDLARKILREDPDNVSAHLELAEANLATFYTYHNAVSLPGIRFFSRARGIGDGRNESESTEGVRSGFRDGMRPSDVRVQDGIAVSDRFDLDQIEAVGGTILDRSDRGYDALDRAWPHLEKVYEQAPDNRAVYKHFMRIAAVTGNYEEVLPRIEQMLMHFREEPEPWLYLGLVQHRLGNEETADGAFCEALSRMPMEERAVYEDVERIRSPREDSLSVEEKESFWRIQDPRYLTYTNERRIEHYARLTYADLLYERSNELGGSGWITEGGQLYVRYGDPISSKKVIGASFIRAVESFAGRGERLSTRPGGGAGPKKGPCELTIPPMINIWEYDTFKLVFCGFENGRNLALYSPPADVFGMVGQGIDPDNMDYVIKARETIREIPERYDYDAPGRVQAPYRLAAFRGENGNADLVLGYGIPLRGRAISRYQDVGATLRTGAFLISNASNELVVERRRTIEGLPGNQIVKLDSVTLWANAEALIARPGEYEVAFEFETADGSAWAAERKPLEVPDFSGGGLQMSEILLAYGVEPGNTEQSGTILRDGLIIQPAPWGVYSTDDPIYLYFEVYGLGRSGNQTNYEVETELLPKDERGFVERIFEDREPGVSNTFPVQADRADDSQYVILDATGQPPGEYTLTVRVEDRVSGQTVERETELFLE